MSLAELSLTPERSLQEKCGIVGIYSNRSSVLQKFEDGTICARALWHRGQQGLGFAINTDQGLQKHIRIGKSIEVALPEELTQTFNQPSKKSNWAVFHTRYGTSGNYTPENLQPLIVKTQDGINFSVTHNGEFVALDQHRREIQETIPQGVSDTYIFSKILQYAPGRNADEKILNTLDKTKGAYSLLIGTDDALYAARDQFGIRPMVIGKYRDGWIIVSETHALNKLGVRTEREIKRGEVIKIDDRGITILKEGFNDAGNFCDLERAYFSRPDSLGPMHDITGDSLRPERWLSNLVFREKCGEALAREYPIPNATFITGVPDSGVPAGTGYAIGMKIPYRQAILRDHYDENGHNRVFMLDENLDSMLAMASGKHSLTPDLRIWKDAVVVMVDDSIVRGTTFKAITQMLFSAGAKEVHLLSAFPQIKHPCHLGVSMRTGDELVAYRNGGDEKLIAKELGATSVHYISPEAFIQARLESSNIKPTQDPRQIFLENGGCGGCITGIYPVSKEGIVYQRKLR